MNPFFQTLQFKTLYFFFYSSDVVYYSINKENQGFSCDFKLSYSVSGWMDCQAQPPQTYRLHLSDYEQHPQFCDELLKALDINKDDVRFLD